MWVTNQLKLFNPNVSWYQGLMLLTWVRQTLTTCLSTGVVPGKENKKAFKLVLVIENLLHIDVGRLY